ncbi:unnamed protein product, partial [Prorocentrum cordatum]
EYEKEHDEMIAGNMMLRLDMELKAQAERDKRDKLKYCRKASLRRHYPPRGVPVEELAWMPLESTVNLEDPERLSKKLEEQKARAAEKRAGEDASDKYSSLYKCKEQSHYLGRCGKAGLASSVSEKDASMECGNKLEDILMKCRQSPAAPVDRN